MHTYLHTYIHTYMHTCILTYVSACIHRCPPPCLPSWPSCLCLPLLACLPACMHACHANMHTERKRERERERERQRKLYMYNRTNMCTCKHTHVCIFNRCRPFVPGKGVLSAKPAASSVGLDLLSGGAMGGQAASEINGSCVFVWWVGHWWGNVRVEHVACIHHPSE